MKAHTILVVDDEPAIRELIKEILEDEGYRTEVAAGAEGARAQLVKAHPALVLLDIWMPGVDGITLLQEWADSETGLPCPIVVMSGHGTVETAVEATRLGAYDYIEKPLSTAKLLLTVRHALETASLQHENVRLKHRRVESFPAGRSRQMRELRDQLQRVAGHDTPVMLTGEPGTYKELVARHLHSLSRRRDQPFVTAMSATAEGPLDAATLDALAARTDGGTLFLKDPADLDTGMQAALYSLLDPAGKTDPPRDFRLVAATRAPLQERVRQGRFRDDLYFRLNVVPIRVPPLRERPEDVPELLEFYVNLAVEQDSLAYRHFSVAAQNLLRGYRWPGNLRELRNLVQRLLILGGGERIETPEIERCLAQSADSSYVQDSLYDLPLREARERFERAYLEYQLDRLGNNVSRIAAVIGVERTHLYRKMKSLGIKAKH